ncbi:MAG: cytosine deaminase, partial [Anaerotruncus massiliensis (ex Togo et al. 2019)]
QMQASNGVQFVRTHVDVTDPTLIAMEGMLELKEELKGIVDIQIVAFPQEGIMSYPNGEQLMENAVRMGADCVGAIPHFEFTREYAVDSVNFCVKLAEKYGKLVDVHCDEIDDEQSKGLEVLACRALESGMKDMVTASQTTAMHSYNNAYCGKLFRLLRMSDINFICNPLVNTHLQGRFDTYPKRRGVTRVKELLENGNNVAFGHDDIFDPWYPLGDGNMRDVIHMGLHVCQLMGYQQIMDSYRFCTYNAARALHLGDSYGIREGNPASFIVLNNDNFYNALNKKSEVLYSNRGKLIAKATPRARGPLLTAALRPRLDWRAAPRAARLYVQDQPAPPQRAAGPMRPAGRDGKWERAGRRRGGDREVRSLPARPRWRRR